MKKQVLFLTMMLVALTSVSATTAGNAVFNGEDFNNARYRFVEPIMFIERGVEFLIFPDGSFDFNTEISNHVSEVYYRNSTTRRGSVNTTFGAPGTISRVHYSTPRPQGVIITHDSSGKVRRIGNVFINYDREGRIKRAGSVYMSYQNRSGLLRQVGGLRVNYNRWGEIIQTSGFVNHNNAAMNCGLGSGIGGHQYDNFTYDDDFNDDFYYYRSKDGNVKKQKKNKKS